MWDRLVVRSRRTASRPTESFSGVSDEPKRRDGIAWTARGSNDAESSLRTLRKDITDIEASIESQRPGDVQRSVKRALEALHELNDCARDDRPGKTPERSMAGWAAGDTELWKALMGARNASHHEVSHVVALHHSGNRDGRLTWDIEPSAIAGSGG
jgi:hypothetical protein